MSDIKKPQFYNNPKLKAKIRAGCSLFEKGFR
jgi:hypothetical protein